MWKRVILGGISLAATGYGIKKYLENEDLDAMSERDEKIDTNKVSKAIDKLLNSVEVNIMEYCKNHDWEHTQRYKDIVKSMINSKNSSHIDRVLSILPKEPKDEYAIDIAQTINMYLNQEFLGVVSNNLSWGWYTFAEMEMIQSIIEEINEVLNEYIDGEKITSSDDESAVSKAQDNC